jgi:GNAT superfamily N-acetyltransferase
VATEGGSDRGDDRPVSAVAKGAATGKSVDVVRLTHQDVPEICALYKRVWDSFRPELPAELVKAWEPTPLEFTSWMEGVTYFAARREGKMIGAIGCSIEDGSCQLVHLAVDPETRRQGIGKALVHAAVDWARYNKSNALWVDALARFEAAAALFKDLEFTACGVLHRHRWNEDVRLFEKTL